MAKAQASLGVTVAVFGFDPSPETAANRALHVLTLRQGLPKAELDARESFETAGTRAVEEAGMRLEAGRKGRGGRLHLVGIDDAPGGRARAVTVWYYATVPYAEVARPAVWSLPGRGLRLDAPDSAALKAALGHLRSSPATWPEPSGCSARCSPATTCFGSTSLSTVARKGANAPSAAGCRSCATAVCSSRSGTPRWLLSASAWPASGAPRGPVDGRRSSSATPGAGARRSSSPC